MTNPRFKWKWSDLIITLILILTVVIVVQKVQLSEKLIMPEQKLMVTIVAEKQFMFFKDRVQVGDPIYQRGSVNPFGTIVAIEEKPSLHLLMDDQGGYHQRELDSLLDIYITIESVGFRSLSNIPVIDRSFFYVNQYLPVLTHRVEFPTRVIDIS